MPHRPDTGSRANRLMELIGIFAPAPTIAFMLLDLWANSKAGEPTPSLARALPPSGGVPLVFIVFAAVLIGADGMFALVGPANGSDADTAERRSSSLAWRLAAVMSALYLFVRARWFWLPMVTGTMAPSDVRERWQAWASTTLHGAPLLAYVWMLTLAVVSVHLGGAVAARLRRRVGAGGPRSSRRASAIGGVLGAAMFLHGAGGVLLLATGWRPLMAAPVENNGSCDEGSAAPAPTSQASSASSGDG